MSVAVRLGSGVAEKDGVAVLAGGVWVAGLNEGTGVGENDGEEV